VSSALKQIARSVLGARPVQSLLAARARRGDPVTVLCYHTLAPDRGGPDAWTALRVADFRDHLAVLREDYNIVALDEVFAAGPGRSTGGRPRAVLTFDDGEAGLHRHLLPLVSAERVPVLVYVATGQIESGRPYWFDRVMGALGEGAREVALPGLGRWSLGAAPGAARWAALGDLLETLKRVHPVAREDLADRIAAENPLPPGRPPLGPMTPGELAELAANPWVTIGAHSHCHNLLDQLPEAEAVASMDRSRRLLQDWTGQDVAHFAWPNGNHSAGLRKAAAQLGFRTAAALDNRLWRRRADLYALPRLAIGRYDDAARFRLRLVGV
jgi:peptidoglycan/xylan/chitin deacetylase (PgdA/CDA1 family)